MFAPGFFPDSRRRDLDAKAEALYRKAAQDRKVPEHLIDGLIGYLVYHIPTGHFMTAALCGDIKGALDRADRESARGFGALCNFLFEVAPRACWGDKLAVEAWLGARFR